MAPRVASGDQWCESSGFAATVVRAWQADPSGESTMETVLLSALT
jgi:hypothetical protein